MNRTENMNIHLVRRTLIPLLLTALPVAAMIAFILYAKRDNPTSPDPQQTAKPAVIFGQDTWPVFRGDPALTGQAQGTLPDKIKSSWTFKTNDAVKSTPVIAENKVFVSSMDSHLYALDLHTGQEVWRFEADEALESSPLYTNGTLYIGSNSGMFYAVNAQDGTEIWSFKTGGKVTGSANISVNPATGQAVVVFGSYDNYLYGADAKTGGIIFKHPAQNYINGSIAVMDHTAAFGSCDANLYLVPIDAPDETRTIDAGSYVAANPAIEGGIIFSGNYDGVFMAADIKTGTVLWRFDKTEDAFFSSPAVNDRAVVVGCRDKKVYCFDRKTGEVLWTYAALEGFDSSPVICGDKVVIGCDDGRLYILDSDTGKEIFAYTLGSPIASSAAVAQNQMVIGCDNGSVYAFIEAR